MNRVFVVGFGKFGQMAIPKIQQRWPLAKIWIIDQSPENLAQGRDMAAIKVLEEGGAFLWEFQDRLRSGDWIIPAVPFHLAGDWLRRILGREHPVRRIKPPKMLGAGLPFLLRLKSDLYVSLADFECPENCPSPRGFCFRTREKRTLRLWEILASRTLTRGTCTSFKAANWPRDWVDTGSRICGNSMKRPGGGNPRFTWLPPAPATA